MKTGFLKKTWVRATLGLVAVGAALGAAQDGYNIFDRKDGSNFACKANPNCRKLTEGEIAMAKTIFGDQIDYKRVKIFNRLMLPWKPHNASAYAWNGNIYVFEKQFQSDDYSTLPTSVSGDLFRHEMTHVWQNQNDSKFIAKGLFELVINDFVYGTLYSYDITDHRTFSSFNFEQQGDIIEQYYNLRESFRKDTRTLTMNYPKNFKRDFNREMRKRCQELDAYTAVISYSIPQEPEAKCAMYRPYAVTPVDPARDEEPVLTSPPQFSMLGDPPPQSLPQPAFQPLPEPKLSL